MCRLATGESCRREGQVSVGGDHGVGLGFEVEQTDLARAENQGAVVLIPAQLGQRHGQAIGITRVGHDHDDVRIQEALHELQGGIYPHGVPDIRPQHLTRLCRNPKRGPDDRGACDSPRRSRRQQRYARGDITLQDQAAQNSGDLLHLGPTLGHQTAVAIAEAMTTNKQFLAHVHPPFQVRSSRFIRKSLITPENSL